MIKLCRDYAIEIHNIRNHDIGIVSNRVSQYAKRIIML